MNQLIIDKAPIGVDHAFTTWELASDPLFNNTLYTVSKSSTELEVHTIIGDVIDDSVFYGRAMRHYRNSDGTISDESWLPYDIVIRNSYGKYDNVVVSDPIHKPVITLEETDSDLIIKSSPLITKNGLSFHTSTSRIILDGNSNVIYKDLSNADNLLEMSIDKNELGANLINGPVTVYVAYDNDLNESSNFSSTIHYPSDDRITMLSNIDDIISSRSNVITFKINSNDPSVTCTGIKLYKYTGDLSNDVNGSVILTHTFTSPVTIDDIGTFDIPSFTLDSSDKYAIIFELTNEITDALKVLITSSNDLVYVSNNNKIYTHTIEELYGNPISIPDADSFSVEILSNSALIYCTKDLAGPDMSDQDRSIFLSSLTDIANDIRSNITIFNDGVSDINIVTSDILSLIDQFKNNVVSLPKKIENPIDIINEYRKLYDDLMQKLYIMNKGTQAEKDIFHNLSNKAASINTHIDLLLEKTFSLHVVRYDSSTEDVGRIDFFDFDTSYFNVVEINYNTVLIDTISRDGVRKFTLVKIDTIGFTNQVVYTTEVSNANNDLIGRNAIVYIKGTDNVYFNKIVDDVNGKTTILMKFNYKSKLISSLTTRPGKPDGTDYTYVNSDLSNIGNGRLLSLGSTYDNIVPYTHDAAFIYDTVTDTWDNISSIPIKFQNEKLISIKLLNNNVIFLLPDDLTSGLLYNVNDNEFTTVTYDVTGFTKIDGLIIPHKNDIVIIGNNGSLVYKYI